MSLQNLLKIGRLAEHKTDNNQVGKLLVACLLGIVVQDSHSIFIGDGIEVFGPAGFILPLFTFGIGAALAGFARYSSPQGWI